MQQSANDTGTRLDSYLVTCNQPEPTAVTPAGLALSAGITALVKQSADGLVNNFFASVLMAQGVWDRAAAAGLTADDARQHLQTVTGPPCRLPAVAEIQADELSCLVKCVAAGFSVGMFGRLAQHELCASDLDELVRLADFGALDERGWGMGMPVPVNGHERDPGRLLRLLNALDVLADIAGSFRAVTIDASEPRLWAGDAADVCACLLIGEVAGLTDTQTARWVAARGTVSPRDFRSWVYRWTSAAGPDGWVWAAAGFTPAETWRLLALPDGHPDRPGPDQLAVMASLRAGSRQ